MGTDLNDEVLKISTKADQGQKKDTFQGVWGYWRTPRVKLVWVWNGSRQLILSFEVQYYWPSCLLCQSIEDTGPTKSVSLIMHRVRQLTNVVSSLWLFQYCVVPVLYRHPYPRICYRWLSARRRSNLWVIFLRPSDLWMELPLTKSPCLFSLHSRVNG